MAERHLTETFRGGAAAETPLNSEETIVSDQPGSESHRSGTDLPSNESNEFVPLGGSGQLPSSRSGGGHRGAFMRYGNDEVKPDDMNIDAFTNEDRMEVKDYTGKETTFENACALENRLYSNCLNDHKDNKDMCSEQLKEINNCKLNYAKYFSTSQGRDKTQT